MPGKPLSICVENLTLFIATSGRGVTLPVNNASMLRGTEGAGNALGVNVTAGGAVIAKLVG